MAMTAQAQRLVLDHLDKCHSWAYAAFGRLRRSYPHLAVPRDDIEQYARLGLVQAAIRYRVENGVKFWTYAEHVIRGAVSDGMRRETKMRAGRARYYMFAIDGMDFPGECRDFADVEAAADLSAIARRTSLTAIDRQTLRCWLGGLPHSEIAAFAGCTETCAGKRRSTLLQKLKAAV